MPKNDDTRAEIEAIIDKTEAVAAIIEDVKLHMEQLNSMIMLADINNNTTSIIEARNIASTMFHEIELDRAKNQEIRSKMEQFLRSI